jgi:DnaJ-class molecular chaperone
MLTFYQILELSKDASDEDIKASYHQKSHALHPDKQDDPQSSKRTSDLSYDMSDLNRAYEVLSDPIRRATYDETLIQHTRDERLQAIRNKRILEQSKSKRMTLFLRGLVIVLVCFFIFTIYHNHQNPHQLQLTQQVDQLKPLIEPQIQSIQKGESIGIHDFLDKPKQNIIRQVLKPTMTPEACLQRFPNELQAKTKRLKD